MAAHWVGGKCVGVFLGKGVGREGEGKVEGSFQFSDFNFQFSDFAAFVAWSRKLKTENWKLPQNPMSP
jgi:hypothetical protein